MPLNKRERNQYFRTTWMSSAYISPSWFYYSSYIRPLRLKNCVNYPWFIKMKTRWDRDIAICSPHHLLLLSTQGDEAFSLSLPCTSVPAMWLNSGLYQRNFKTPSPSFSCHGNFEGCDFQLVVLWEGRLSARCLTLQGEQEMIVCCVNPLRFHTSFITAT